MQEIFVRTSRKVGIFYVKATSRMTTKFKAGILLGKFISLVQQ